MRRIAMRASMLQPLLAFLERWNVSRTMRLLAGKSAYPVTFWSEAGISENWKLDPEKLWRSTLLKVPTSLPP